MVYQRVTIQLEHENIVVYFYLSVGNLYQVLCIMVAFNQLIELLISVRKWMTFETLTIGGHPPRLTRMNE